MARNENPPFGRGQTFYNGGTIDTTNYGGLELEGKIWEFEDIQYSGVGAKPARTNRSCKCMCVRNVSGGALLPGRLVTLQTAGTDGRYFMARVDGYADVNAQANAYPVDEWLPAAGVPNGDLFWIVVEGPASVLNGLAGDATNVIAVGQALVAMTAVTSGATTAGRVYPQDLSGSQTSLGNQIGNRIGYALSAATTANTGVSILMDVRRW